MAVSTGPAPDGIDGPAEVAPRDFPTNRGGLCAKGWSAAELLDHPDRLTTPLVRDGGELRPSTWDEALDRVTSAIRTAQERHGPESVGCFGGGGLTNEKAYQFGKFARVALRTPYIDYNGRFCMSSAAYGSIVPALYVYVGLYAMMLAVTWAFYLRRSAPMARAGV